MGEEWERSGRGVGRGVGEEWGRGGRGVGEEWERSGRGSERQQENRRAAALLQPQHPRELLGRRDAQRLGEHKVEVATRREPHSELATQFRDGDRPPAEFELAGMRHLGEYV